MNINFCCRNVKLEEKTMTELNCWRLVLMMQKSGKERKRRRIQTQASQVPRFVIIITICYKKKLDINVLWKYYAQLV